uniref:LPD38 domain-containing protein n=1 Tax=Rhodoferax sp. TaxID=50421 RepID=UPI00374CCC0E
LLTPFEERMFGRQNNAFADANETITWALTDRDAQAFLDSIAYKGKSAWTSFVQIIRSLLGLDPKADTALVEILRVSEALLDDETHTLTDAMLSRDGKDTVMQRGMTDMQLPQDSITQAHQSAGPATNRERIAEKLRNAGGGPKIIGDTGRKYTPAQLDAMRAVGFQVTAPTLEERAKAAWKDAGKKLAQGLVDQFAPIKAISTDAYALLRLAKGASGAFEAMLQGGKLKLSDGVYDFDDTQRGGVVDTLLKPLGGEHHDFFRWVAANRAERLKGEGKENLFTADDIKALKTLADGTAAFDYILQHGPNAGTKTRDRSLIYADALKTFNGFNKNVLDLAEQSGLIDGESRKLWEHEFYVPFYRVAEEEGGSVAGMNIKGGSVRQQAFKQLKGGKQALNADLMDNTLMNWAHLLDASAKNRAAVATLAAAENMGAAITAPEATAREMANSIGQKSNVVWVMDGGQKHFYVVEDPYVMTALTSLEYAGMRSPIMKALGSFKHALTIGVTASPFFKVRNLIRDSVQAIASAPLSYNVAGNLAEGWKLTDPKSDAYFRLLAGGGTIHFGTMMEGSEAKRVQALVESGVDSGTILNSDQKFKAFYRKFIEPSITAYSELGNRGEAINRAALYAQLRKQGMSHAQASLQARDLMDFSMQGSFTSVRFLTQVVPFFNARLQGLYKLGRAAKEDPARIATVIGAAALAGIGLILAYGDDDDWKKREDWDKNNFWWFKFGGTAFRIPKPFEVGAIATLAERGFELAFDKEMDGKRFRNNVLALLSDNLSMNPVPQLVKPMIDIYANKNSFTGRPIETMGMERLQSEYRFTGNTSMLARGASTAANAVASLVGAQALSPVQIDHLLQGYFGWLGSFVVGASDILARPATGQPTKPDADFFKAATGGMVSDLRDAPSRYVSQMYQQATAIEQAYATWKSLIAEGKGKDAAEFFAENRDEIIKHRSVEGAKRAEAKANAEIKAVERSDMTSAEKRERIRLVLQRKDRIARPLTEIH